MREGLLWYDANPKRPPQSKLDDALVRFLERFGRGANCCHVAPLELFNHPAVSVIPDPAVLPHHFLVGRDESLEPARARTKRTAARAATSAHGTSPVSAPPPVATALVERPVRAEVPRRAPRRPKRASEPGPSETRTPAASASRRRSTTRRV
jgi:hypothetical protein